MLILTRRVGESVMIGDDIVVTVVEVRGDSIRLGISAPRSVDVHREEVHRELKEANRQAASPDRGAVDELTRQLTGRRSPEPEEPEAGAV